MPTPNVKPHKPYKKHYEYLRGGVEQILQTLWKHFMSHVDTRNYLRLRLGLQKPRSASQPGDPGRSALDPRRFRV